MKLLNQHSTSGVSSLGVPGTDKETDESWDISMIRKTNLAVGWAGLQRKKVWADYEQLLGLFF